MAWNTQEPGFENTQLVNGECEFPNGFRSNGRRKWIKELKRMEIVEGTKLWKKSKKECEGSFAYYPQLNRMGMLVGTLTYPSGDKYCGVWEFSKETGRIEVSFFCLFYFLFFSRVKKTKNLNTLFS